MKNGDPICELLSLVEILRGEQNGGPLLGELLNDLPHVDARFGVEPRGRLIEEDHLRLPDQAHGDVQATAHAS